MRWLWVLVLLVAALPSLAADPPAGSEAAKAAAGGFADFRDAIERSIAAENQTLKELQSQNRSLAPGHAAFEASLNAYSLQLSAHGNLLLLANAPIEELQRGMALNTSTMAELEERLKRLRSDNEASRAELSKTVEQLRLNAEQSNVFAGESDPDALIKSALQNLQRLNRALEAKRDLLGKIVAGQENLINQVEGLRDGFAALNERLNKSVALRKKERLFTKGPAPYTLLAPARLAEDGRQAWVRVRGLLAAGSRTDTHGEDLRGVLFWLTATLLLLGMGLPMLQRLRPFLQRAESGCGSNRFRGFVLRLLRGCQGWLGAWLLLALLCQLGPPAQVTHVLRLLLLLVTVQLFTLWGSQGLNLVDELALPHPTAPTRLKLQRLRGVARLSAFAHLLLGAVFGADGGVALIVRLGFGVWFLTWSLRLRSDLLDASQPPAAGVQAVVGRWLALGVALALPLVAIGLDLSGHSNLARHWYGSWAGSGVLLFWGALIGAMFWELEGGLPAGGKTDAAATASGGSPLAWLALRVVQLLAALLWLSGFIWIWGGEPDVWNGVLKLLRYQIPLGEMRFSLSGVIHAAVVLLVTHAAARLWRHVLRRRLLRASGLEAGVQESVLALSTYVVWAVGLLVALRTLGLNATSMAVAFGALGVGLGFGLQAIFNNFISGLILLFERPIRVGDAVEVGGTWGVVKKINVRSTLVQTYDNATLIIPNSEFISSQVTNWSFKDQRLRRMVKVGVAYGSDVELVRRTLAEIAAENAHVLSFPRPDVIFSDFGDSALIFTLRFWTTIDRTPGVESAIRFAIDRRFREHGIEIPFPQQEIRLRADQLPVSFSPADPAA
jgi:small-conductance mechanosensitive channel